MEERTRRIEELRKKNKARLELNEKMLRVNRMGFAGLLKLEKMRLNPQHASIVRERLESLLNDARHENHKLWEAAMGAAHRLREREKEFGW